MLDMNINKAIRKQTKSYKRFVLLMCFVFFMLPAFMVIYHKETPFYMIYLAVIEAMIIAAVLIRANKQILKFTYVKTGRIRLRCGLTGEMVNIYCNKVLYVDIEAEDVEVNKFQDFRIILLSNSKFKNRRLKKVSYEFMKKYTLAAFHYNKFKAKNPQDEFYYFIIGSGGLKKYALLSTIYASCVHAGFSEAAIEKIKLYRENLG